MNPLHQSSWRHGGVGYQIYLRSFYDANGDGVGDLKGVTAKLDYLNDGTPNSLGVSCIWLSPCNPSPMADFGYDVANYYEVEPLFGCLDDFKELLSEAHKRGIRVLMDFVVNHTSEEHDWFKESRSSRDNPKRDWYTWRDAKPDGSPPNNWIANFGGSAWEWDEATQQYYLHSFLKEQPDLNWDNPAVRQAIKEAMKFWLDLGVDGFRLDAVSWISKDKQLRDNPRNPDYREGIDDPYFQVIITYSWEGPKLFDYLNEINELVAGYPDRFIITEAYPDNRDDIPAYMQFYRGAKYDISAPFNFELIMMPWQARRFKNFIDKFQAALLPADIPVYVLGNLDRIRVATRIGHEAARAAAILMLTLPGLPFVYQGDELGLENVTIPPELVQDPFEKNVPGMGFGRDPGRTPMQWSSETNAGFTTAKPWLPLSSDYAVNNVTTQAKGNGSSWSLHRDLIHLRNASDILKYGSYEPIDQLNQDIFMFGRVYNGNTYVMAINFSDKFQTASLPLGAGRLLLTSHVGTTTLDQDFSTLRLQPHEAIIVDLVTAPTKTTDDITKKPRLRHEL